MSIENGWYWDGLDGGTLTYSPHGVLALFAFVVCGSIISRVKLANLPSAADVADET